MSISNLFNEFYINISKNIFQQCQKLLNLSDNTITKNRYSNKNSIFVIPTSTDKICYTIMNLKTTDSCGNDNILSVRILKHISDMFTSLV